MECFDVCSDLLMKRENMTGNFNVTWPLISATRDLLGSTNSTLEDFGLLKTYDRI